MKYYVGYGQIHILTEIMNHLAKSWMRDYSLTPGDAGILSLLRGHEGGMW